MGESKYADAAPLTSLVPCAPGAASVGCAPLDAKLVYPAVLGMGAAVVGAAKHTERQAPR